MNVQSINCAMTSFARLLLILLLGAAGAAAQSYTVTPLLPPAGYVLLNLDGSMNNNGQVLGEVRSLDGTVRLPALWTSGVPQILPMPSGYVYQATLSTYKVNDAGIVIGTVYTAGSLASHISVWNGGVPSILPDAPVPGACVGAGCTCSTIGQSVSYGLNSAGHILGGTSYPSLTPGGPGCNGVWVYNGATYRLLTTPIPPECVGLPAAYGGGVNWSAVSINDADRVLAGVTNFFCGPPYITPGVPWSADPAVIEPGGTVSFLPLGGLGGAFATSISNNGDVLGYYTAPTHLVVWNSAGVHDLGPSGYGYMNNFGQVAYISNPAGSPQAQIWQNGVSTPIPVPAGFPLNAGVVAGYNDAGQIAVQVPGVGLYLLTPSSTTTSLDTSPNPSTLGQSVTMTATVTSGPGIPGGNVTFYDGSTNIGNQTLDSSGRATLNASLTTGSHILTASYAGNVGFGSSNSASVTQTVNRASSSTSVVSSTNPSVAGQTVTFTASVSSSVGVPTGTLTFQDGSVPLGTVGLSGSTASFSTSSLAIGAHSITAVYSGDAANLGSTSAALNQSVIAAMGVTVATAPPGLTIAVDSVTYTAPQTFSWLPGSAHTIATVSPQTNNLRYIFMNWSDGGEASHSVITPASAATYTANFVAAAMPVPSRVLAWGSNGVAELGYVDTANFRSQEVVDLGAGSGTARIAAGGAHNLALKSDGTVLAWGLGDNGRLGNGTFFFSTDPQPVPSLPAGSGVIAIAAGGAHSLALKSNGTVLAWGQNLSGQLGDGTTTDRLTPVQVSGLGPGSGVVAIAAGLTTSYALKSDGTVVAWGSNANSEIGDGTTTPRPTPVQVSGLGAGSGVVAIVSGSSASHALALKSDGSVISWGANTSGQLGDGTSTPRTSPVSVSGFAASSGVIALAAGANHSLALKSDGEVFAWGVNFVGQLGDGTTTQKLTPNPVTGFGAGSGAITISAGSGSSMVATSSATFAFGRNTFGEVGDGTLNTALLPVMVVGLPAGVTAVAAGAFHDLALNSSGALFGWGSNNYGLLGRETNDGVALPRLVEGLTDVLQASTSGSFNLALKSDGTVWSFGNNSNGQLGNGISLGNGYGTAVPVQVKDATGTSFLTNIVAVSAGDTHGLALQADGTVWAWGNNGNGRLGDGTTTQRLLPVQVTGFGPGSGVVAISAGATHTLALKSNGSVWAWGNNANGRLGDGTQTQKLTPVQVSGLGVGSGVVAIVAASNFSLALKADGTVLGWGADFSGQLGDGTQTQKLTPVPVKDPSGTGLLSGIIAIAANGSSLALKSDGTVWAWGSNGVGQLGDGTTTDRLLPVQVRNAAGTGFLNNITAVASGSFHSGALKSDGTVWDWGIGLGIGDGKFNNNPLPTQAVLTQAIATGAGGGNTPNTSSHSLALVPMTVPTVTIALETSPTGLRVTTDGITYTAPQTLLWLAGTGHDGNVQSPQYGTAGTRFVFDSVTNIDVNAPYIPTPATPTTITVNFVTQHLLTTAVAPSGSGTVTTNPSSPDGYYDSGTPVQLTAVAAPGLLFNNWSGDLSGSNNPQSITMTAPRSVTANFGADITTIVDTAPSGRSIVVDNVTYSTPQTFHWAAGSNHTIATGSPQTGNAGTRFNFANWSDGGALSHAITVPSSSTTYTANFTTQYQLTISNSPTIGGTSSPASGTFFDAGQVVPITATPDTTYYKFTSWGGPVASFVSASTTVTMTGPIALQANFTPLTAFIPTVSVTRIPDGNYIVSVTLRNMLALPMQDMKMNAISLNNVTVIPLPLPPGTPRFLQTGESLTFTANVPATAGAPGTAAVVRYSGSSTYTTFSGSVRVTLPN